MCAVKTIQEKCYFLQKYGTVIKLQSAKKPLHSRQKGDVRIGRPYYSKILATKSTALAEAGCSENELRKVCFFTEIRQSYKTLISNIKTTAPMAATCRENWSNRLFSNFRQKSTALKAAGCNENKLRKVGIFKAIWHSYGTLVDNKSTALTAAGCRENWPNWLVNNLRKKIHSTQGSWVPWKLAAKSMLFQCNTAQL